MLTVKKSGICPGCSVSYDQAWCVGERTEALKTLIDLYKFHRTKNAASTLAGLLDDVLPLLPSNVTVTSVPTISRHVRQRGYDHALLIAQRFARIRKLPYAKVLVRNKDTIQHGASRLQRINQAKTAFSTKSRLSGEYLLIDDVFTTGSTVEYAARALKEAGASEVWIAIISRQPLEKTPET